MYIKNNKIYSDAFNILKFAKKMPDFEDEDGNSVEGGTETSYAYEYDASFAELITEEKIDLSDVLVKKGYAYFNNGKVAQKITFFDKKELKIAVINKRYDNNDQIALMLNKDASEEALMYYNKMQAWREFADQVATAIINAHVTD